MQVRIDSSYRRKPVSGPAAVFLDTGFRRYDQRVIDFRRSVPVFLSHLQGFQLQKKIAVLLVFITALFGFGAGSWVPKCRAADQPPAEGGVLPDFSLPVSQRYAERQYLGTGPDGRFKIPQLKARLVLIEIFSMYCPYCQREAPNVNQLFELIEGRPQLKDKIKIIGIGAGNTPFEVNAFRDLYRIAFPLFSDEDFSIHKLMGQVRTPYFIAVKLKPGGKDRVIYSKVGSFGDPEQFLDQLVAGSELK